MSEKRPQEGDRHPHAKEPSRGGSGTTQSDSAIKKQAGSYSRDAEQDPASAPDSETEE
jgi:hypothetical protein